MNFTRVSPDLCLFRPVSTIDENWYRWKTNRSGVLFTHGVRVNKQKFLSRGEVTVARECFFVEKFRFECYETRNTRVCVCVVCSIRFNLRAGVRNRLSSATALVFSYVLRIYKIQFVTTRHLGFLNRSH